MHYLCIFAKTTLGGDFSQNQNFCIKYQTKLIKQTYDNTTYKKHYSLLKKIMHRNVQNKLSTSF